MTFSTNITRKFVKRIVGHFETVTEQRMESSSSLISVILFHENAEKTHSNSPSESLFIQRKVMLERVCQFFSDEVLDADGLDDFQVLAKGQQVSDQPFLVG